MALAEEGTNRIDFAELKRIQQAEEKLILEQQKQAIVDNARSGAQAILGKAHLTGADISQLVAYGSDIEGAGVSLSADTAALEEKIVEAQKKQEEEEAKKKAEEVEEFKKAAEALLEVVITPAMAIEAMNAENREQNELMEMTSEYEGSEYEGSEYEGSEYEGSEYEELSDRSFIRDALIEEAFMASGNANADGTEGNGKTGQALDLGVDQAYIKELIKAGEWDKLNDMDLPPAIQALVKSEQDLEAQAGTTKAPDGTSATPAVEESTKSTDTPPEAPAPAPQAAAPVVAREPDVAPDVLKRQAVDKAIQAVKDSGRVGWGNMTADDEKTIAKFVDDTLGPDPKAQDIKDFTKSLGGSDRALANQLTDKVVERHNEIEKANSKGAEPMAAKDSHPFADLIKGVQLMTDRLLTDPKINTPTGTLVAAMLAPGGVVPAATIAGGAQQGGAGMGSAA